MSKQSRLLVLAAGLLVPCPSGAQDIQIGLVAARTGAPAHSGEAPPRAPPIPAH